MAVDNNRYDLFLPNKKEVKPEQIVDYGDNWRTLELWARGMRALVDSLPDADHTHDHDHEDHIGYISGVNTAPGTVQGYDRADLGIVDDTARLILEDNGTIWYVDNQTGTLRFSSTTLLMYLDAAGDLYVIGDVSAVDASFSGDLDVTGLATVGDIDVAAVPPNPQPIGTTASPGLLTGPPARPDHIHTSLADIGVRAILTGTATLAISAHLMIPWDSMTLIGGMTYDTVNEEFIIPTTAWYYIESRTKVEWSNTGSLVYGYVTYHLMRNPRGADPKVIDDDHPMPAPLLTAPPAPSSVTEITMKCGRPVLLTAGDRVSAEVDNHYALAGTVLGEGTFSGIDYQQSWLEIHRLPW